MKTFIVYNLGCKVNAYELSAISSLLINEGFKEDNKNPDVVIITAIDKSHYLYFGSEEKIVAEVCSIVKHMPDQGIVIVNMDEFNRFDLLEGHKTITVSTNNIEADFFANNIELDENGLRLVEGGVSPFKAEIAALIADQAVPDPACLPVFCRFPLPLFRQKMFPDSPISRS